MECWSCHRAAGGGLICDACGAVQPPRAGADKFAQLGLPATYALEPALLDDRYRELSRRLHPDRFAKAEAKARVLSLQAATALNDAYRTLRTPVRRAEYLLERAGLPLGENDTVDPELLGDVLELREALAEAKAEGDTARAAAMAADVRARRDAAMAHVAERFAERERRAAGGRTANGDGGLLAEIKDALVAVRYYQRFLDEEEAGNED